MKSDGFERHFADKRAKARAKRERVEAELETFKEFDMSSPLWAGRSWALKVKSLFVSHGEEFERGFREEYGKE